MVGEVWAKRVTSRLFEKRGEKYIYDIKERGQHPAILIEHSSSVKEHCTTYENLSCSLLDTTGNFEQPDGMDVPVPKLTISHVIQ